MANPVEQEYIIFVGNPGTGKSTLLNGLIGSLMFQSGVSFGSGLTDILQMEKHPNNSNVTFIDTPGLNDVDKREKAAKEIEKAMKLNGNYKIFFVVMLDAGRVRPDDSATMQVVLDAIKTKERKIPFAVVINKLSKGVLDKLKNNKDNPDWDKAIGCLFKTGYATDQIFLYPREEEIEDVQNVLPKKNEEFVKFVDKVTGHYVKTEEVDALNVQNFDELKKELEAKNATLMADVNAMKEAMKEYQEQLEVKSKVVEERRIPVSGNREKVTGTKEHWKRDTIWYDVVRDVSVEQRQVITRANGTVEEGEWKQLRKEEEVVQGGQKRHAGGMPIFG